MRRRDAVMENAFLIHFQYRVSIARYKHESFNRHIFTFILIPPINNNTTYSSANTHKIMTLKYAVDDVKDGCISDAQSVPIRERWGLRLLQR